MPEIHQKTYKDLCNFTLVKKIENDNSFSHDVFLAEKIKNGYRTSLWYIKYLGSNRNEAIIETLAQEFYRLILPQQPKTRRTISETKTRMFEYHVLSKKIDFDEKFFSISKKGNYINEKKFINIVEGSIKGLAATQILALWLNEVDFKAGNVGIDRDGRVVKIDGGLSFIKLNPRFWNLYEGKNLEITQADLEALPNLVNYAACNWLQQIQWNLEQKCAIKIKPTKLDKKINKSSQFKNELYQTILCIISLPDKLIQFFTQSYIANPDDITRFSDFIITRKKQLKLAAEQIPAFNEYRHSNQAREEMLDFLNYLRTFKTMGKSFLFSEFENQSKIDIEALVLGNMIKEYTSIKNFATELDTYHQNLNQSMHEEINFELLMADFIFNPNLEKILANIVSLKEIVIEYLTSPTLFKKNSLHKTLADVVKTIKEENVTENTIISALVESINKVLAATDNLKKIKKPIPTPRVNKSTQVLPSIGYFSANHQKVSAAYHQRDIDTPPPHNFILR